MEADANEMIKNVVLYYKPLRLNLAAITCF